MGLLVFRIGDYSSWFSLRRRLVIGFCPGGDQKAARNVGVPS